MMIRNLSYGWSALSVLLLMGVLFLGSSFNGEIYLVEDSCSCDRERDSLALVALYEATDGANWTNTWDLEMPMDSWNNVTLNEEGCVRTLILSSYQLNGNIPEELGQLSDLTYIDLRGNQLSGSIPTELGQLSNLAVLLLSENQLIGSIPAELGQLDNLVRLVLSENQLSGGIPVELGQLSNLEDIIFFQNELSGSIPTELGQVSSLQKLDLRNNRLNGSIPTELGQLSRLFDLRLNGNQLSGSIPTELGQASNLQKLDLSNNQLNGSIPVEIGQPSNLFQLFLSNNQLSGNIPPELGQISNLGILDLSNNQLSGSIPPALGQLSDLGWLFLFGNELSGSIPVELANIDGLDRLALSDNQLSGCIPDNLQRFCNLGQQEYNENGFFDDDGYNLTNNPLLAWQGELSQFCAGESQIGAPCDDGNPETENDVITAECDCQGTVVNPCRERDSLALVALYEATDGANWSNTWDLAKPMIGWRGVTLNAEGCVTRLFLFNNQLSGRIPVELGQLSRLTILNLSSNQLSGNVPVELGQLSSLTELSLGNNQLSGSIPSGLGQLSNLTEFSLWGNQLTGSIPVGLGQSSGLIIIQLFSNDLSGNIPPDIGQLNNLNELQLSFNQLEGNIPTELGQLSSLTELGLGDNQLEGSIPPELGQLSNLTELSLFGNQLEGSIPAELGQLSNLTRLSLSGNQLSGSIPVELGELNNLVDLFINENQIEGNIPVELARLSSLEWLYLFDNQLNGSIPAELRQLNNLTFLYLHNNQLSGSIPVELGELNNLIRLSLSDNQLSGCIPNNLQRFCDLGQQTYNENGVLIANGYNLTNNSLLPWQGNFSRFCAGESQIGAPCDDGDFATRNDIITENCECLGCTDTETTLNENICEGETYTVGEMTFTTAGEHQIPLQSVRGCDSLIILQLAVFAPDTSFTTATICSGEDYTFNGQNYNDTGTYPIPLTTAQGCDSMAVLELYVTPQTESIETAQICSNQTYDFYGRMLNESGVYYDTLRSAVQCDSIIRQLELIVAESALINIDTTLCAGEIYTLSGETYAESTTREIELISETGCDSTIMLNLTVLPDLNSITTVTICEGESYLFNGQNYSETGNYSQNLMGTMGCDSTAILQLSVTPLQQLAETEQICTNQSYNFNGRLLTESGIYQDTLRTANQCDSIITELALSVAETLRTDLTETICEGESYPFGNTTYTTSGNYTDTLTSQAGCDSVVHLALSVLPVFTTTIDTTLCANAEYELNGEIYTRSGSYEQRLTTVAGCDSLLQLELTILDETALGAATAGTDVVLCGEYQYELQSNLPANTTGEWTAANGVVIANPLSPLTTVFDLQPGDNRLTWTLSTADCPAYSSADIVIAVEEAQPVANADEFTMSFAQKTLEASLVANDVDVPTALSIDILTPPTAGKLEVAADGTFIYTLRNIAQRDRFTYRLFAEYCPELADTAEVSLLISDLPTTGATDAFSPNGDGDNEEFVIPELDVAPDEYPNNELIVFNRWGQLVYQAAPYTNSWNGTLRDTNKPLPAGTYYYIVRLNVGEGEIRYGQVTILR